MLYPPRFQVRQSTVLVIVLLLMGSVLYEVTRTESVGRQSAVRTQDISLPAPKPVEHKIVANVRPDYIGRTSAFSATTKPVTFDGDVALATGAAATTGTSLRTDSSGDGASEATFGRAVATRVHSATSSGYSAGAYGMGGVGAWGGVSGMIHPAETKAATAPKAAKAPKTAKADKPKQPRAGSGGATSGSSGAGTGILATGFTTGAAAVEAGAVAAVQNGQGASPASSPASTPEPMSLLLMGTGLVALYNVRRHLQ